MIDRISRWLVSLLLRRIRTGTLTVIEPGAVATELTDHITHGGAKQMAEEFYEQVAITAQDIAEIIAFAITRPHRVTLNEILIRPTAQP